MTADEDQNRERELVARIDEHVTALVKLSDGIRWGDDKPGSYALGRLEMALDAAYPERAQRPNPATTRRARRTYTPAVALRVAGVACAQCGSTDRVVLDHIVPLAKDGDDDPTNLQPLCTPCNTAKGGR